MFMVSLVFFFNDTATTEIYTYGQPLSLHDALPISRPASPCQGWGPWEHNHLPQGPRRRYRLEPGPCPARLPAPLQHPSRSEEHTSELQSLMRISYAVFCLKKKNKRKYILTTTSNKLDTCSTVHTRTDSNITS